MAARDLIVLGTSTGGVEALVRLVRGLPRQFPAPLLVVEHLPPVCESRLPQILSRAGPLPAVGALDHAPIEPGRIYVAPPDYHLCVEPGQLRLSHAARENRFRPSIDPLFRSAARHYGDRVIAVLLTGGLGDGVAGLLAVRNAGGLAIVQDPDDAFAPAMPLNAIQIAGADHVVPVADMPALLVSLVGQSTARGAKLMKPDPIEEMDKVVDHDMHAQEEGLRPRQPSVYSCPECGGVLWQLGQAELVRFRCHTGHAYYAEQLLEGQAETLEAALWTAVRIFRERGTLARQLSGKERERGNASAAARYDDQAKMAEDHGKSILEHLLNNETGIFPPCVQETPHADAMAQTSTADKR